MWTYSGMRPGLVIRRDWDRDGVPWLAREEPWDFDRYGDHGTVTDISVYDRDYGLLPGVYDLRLSIDGFLTSQGRFVIAAWGTESARSPDGRRLARVRPPGTLVVQDLPGEPHAFEVAGEIADLAWFPDSRHIAFSEVDRSAEIPNSGGVGRGYRLWLFDPETERKTLLAGGGLALHQPFPSPDGRFLAALDGSGWGDACMYDLGLVILRLSASLQPNEVYRLEDFTGIPEIAPDELAAIYPYDVFWTGAAELQAGLAPICLQDLTPGVYRLDVNARRVIDAPSAPTPGASLPASASPTTGPTPTGTPTPP